MKPDKYTPGIIDAGDFQWHGLFDAIKRITTEKAEDMLKDALGLYLEDGPMASFILDDAGNACLELCFWLGDDPPFAARYPLDALLKEAFEEHDSLSPTHAAIKSLIDKYEDQP